MAFVPYKQTDNKINYIWKEAINQEGKIDLEKGRPNIHFDSVLKNDSVFRVSLKIP